MAAPPGVRRAPMGRADVEALASTVVPDQNLPVIYLKLEATETGTDRFASAYVLRRRAGGFMVLVPDAELTRDFFDTLFGEDGEALALVQREQVHAESVRGRQLGPAHVLLVDLPWGCAELFVEPGCEADCFDGGRHQWSTATWRRIGRGCPLGGSAGSRHGPGVLRKCSGGGRGVFRWRAARRGGRGRTWSGGSAFAESSGSAISEDHSCGTCAVSRLSLPSGRCSRRFSASATSRLGRFGSTAVRNQSRLCAADRNWAQRQGTSPQKRNNYPDPPRQTSDP